MFLTGKSSCDTLYFHKSGAILHIMEIMSLTKSVLIAFGAFLNPENIGFDSFYQVCTLFNRVTLEKRICIMAELLFIFWGCSLITFVVRLDIESRGVVTSLT